MSFTKKYEDEIARVHCRLNKLNYPYGPGVLIARLNRMEFIPHSSSISNSNDLFPFEKMNPIRAYNPKGLRKYLRKIFYTGFMGSFMYAGERYSLRQYTEGKEEFDNFVEVVNKYIENS